MQTSAEKYAIITIIKLILTANIFYIFVKDLHFYNLIMRPNYHGQDFGTELPLRYGLIGYFQHLQGRQ